MVRAALLGRIEERSAGRVLAVPSVFVRDQITNRFARELRDRAVEVGVDRIEQVVDEAVPERDPDTPAEEPRPAAERLRAERRRREAPRGARLPVAVTHRRARPGGGHQGEPRRDPRRPRGVRGVRGDRVHRPDDDLGKLRPSPTGRREDPSPTRRALLGRPRRGAPTKLDRTLTTTSYRPTITTRMVGWNGCSTGDTPRPPRAYAGNVIFRGHRAGASPSGGSVAWPSSSRRRSAGTGRS